MSVPLATLGDTAADYVVGLERLRGPVTVIRRCTELTEVLAVCESGLAEAAVITEQLDQLTSHLIDRMARLRVPVVVLTGDRAEADRLARVGAVVLPATVSATDLTAAVLAAVAGPYPTGLRPDEPRPADQRTARGDAEPGTMGRTDGTQHPTRDTGEQRAGTSAGAGAGTSAGTSDGSTAGAPSSAAGLGRFPGLRASARSTDRTGTNTTRNEPDRDERDREPAVEGSRRSAPPHREHRGDTAPDGSTDAGEGLTDDAVTASDPDADAGLVIAVWGPAGSPGRSTVAVNLAAELTAEFGSGYLLDTDTYGSSTAVMLGLLDESAPLAQACRLADQGLLDTAALHRVSADVIIAGGRLRALTGITRPDRWPELRSSALGAVVEACRATARTTVIDCGFCLEADEELSFDSVAPRRNGATLRSLELADVVIAVGSADAIGLPRLVKGLAQLAEAVPACRPVVAINRLRRETVGRGSEHQVRDAWERYGPAIPIAALLPWDAAADAALLGGTVLRESAPGSALRAGIRSLIPAELGVAGAGRRTAAGTRRWRRRSSVAGGTPPGI